jgi:hypothetical protein
MAKHILQLSVLQRLLYASDNQLPSERVDCLKFVSIS